MFYRNKKLRATDYTMSLRLWNSIEDRKKLLRVNSLFQYTFIAAYRRKRELELEYNSDDDDDDDNNEQTNRNPYVDPLRVLWVIGYHQRARVLCPIEDDNIVFGQTKTINNFTEHECLLYFRFLKDDLIEVANQLWPRLRIYLNSNDVRRIEVGNKYIAHYETCLCAYLFKMSHPCRLIGEVESFFGIRKSKLSQMIRFFGQALYELAIQYLSNPNIWHHKMPYYALVISNKINGMFDNIWGYIDGTVRKTCRPMHFQQVLYTRYKRCHAIKFQSVVTPDGYVACLAGPFVGRRHDSRMLRESQLVEQLEALMPEDGSNGTVYTLYGDLAYPQSAYIFGGFVAPDRNSPEARFNQAMSRIRIAVEWGFATILRRWTHLDFTRSMKLFEQPIAQQFINCAFLVNLQNCFYGGATNVYFDCNVMSLQVYLQLID
ncbi:MAG: transposase family protein [Thermonemataceae bacterium]|nr:transposase family protein [Thermonemataceae bacterium]